MSKSPELYRKEIPQLGTLSVEGDYFMFETSIMGIQTEIELNSIRRISYAPWESRRPRWMQFFYFLFKGASLNGEVLGDEGRLSSIDHRIRIEYKHPDLTRWRRYELKSRHLSESVFEELSSVLRERNPEIKIGKPR
ncbi:MAG: hypothetical protein SchgKO_06550 [Schleiferiaceae bacterium]